MYMSKFLFISNQSTVPSRKYLALQEHLEISFVRYARVFKNAIRDSARASVIFPVHKRADILPQYTDNHQLVDQWSSVCSSY